VIEDLHAEFEKYNDEYIKFELIENPRHRRQDLCAFLMLDDLLGGGGGVVSSAGHDEIFIKFDCGDLREKATPDFIRDLVRCGVRYDSNYDSLCMFV
jgi:hypothetical protein